MRLFKEVCKMRLLKKEREEKLKVEDIFVVKAELLSNYNDGSGVGPMHVTQYFLAEIKDEQICELFSGTVLEEENEDKHFNTYYVIKSKPLKIFLKNAETIKVNKTELFNFINNLNAVHFLGGDTF